MGQITLVKKIYGQNVVGYTACTAFPEELLDLRKHLFCDLSATDVGRFKNFNGVFPNTIYYIYPNQKLNVRLPNLKIRCHGPDDLFFQTTSNTSVL